MKFFGIYNPTDEKGVFSSLFKTHKVIHITAPALEENQLADFYRTLAYSAGVPLIYEEDPITGRIIPEKWTSIKYEAGAGDLSYKSSDKFQPLHTDYGYFSFEMYASFFYCVSQASFGGATTFIDAEVIAELLQLHDAALFEKACTVKINFGRKGNPLAHFADTILSRDEIGWKINWNYYRAIEDTEQTTLIDLFKSFLDRYIEKSGELLSLKLQPGEGVFFHDRRVLHGRNSFIGNRHLNKGGLCTPEVAAHLKTLSASK